MRNRRVSKYLPINCSLITKGKIVSTILKIEKKMDQILTTGSIKSLIRDKWVMCFQI